MSVCLIKSLAFIQPISQIIIIGHRCKCLSTLSFLLVLFCLLVGFRQKLVLYHIRYMTTSTPELITELIGENQPVDHVYFFSLHFTLHINAQLKQIFCSYLTNKGVFQKYFLYFVTSSIDSGLAHKSNLCEYSAFNEETLLAGELRLWGQIKGS